MVMKVFWMRRVMWVRLVNSLTHVNTYLNMYITL